MTCGGWTRCSVAVTRNGSATRSQDKSAATALTPAATAVSPRPRDGRNSHPPRTQSGVTNGSAPRRWQAGSKIRRVSWNPPGPATRYHPGFDPRADGSRFFCPSENSSSRTRNARRLAVRTPAPCSREQPVAGQTGSQASDAQNCTAAFSFPSRALEQSPLRRRNASVRRFCCGARMPTTCVAAAIPLPRN
jgi:hypothetical protein